MITINPRCRRGGACGTTSAAAPTIAFSMPIRWTPPPHLRERLQAFSRHVGRRFVEDRCFDSAAVLAFGTVFALVPLSTTAFGILSAFPIFADWNQAVSTFLFAHFVPEAAQAVEGYLRQFTDSASRLTAAGLAAVVVSALIIMKSVEDTFNQIWRVRVARPRAARFLLYWAALTLGPLLLAASLALSSWLLTSPWLNQGGLGSVLAGALGLLPILLELTAFSLAFAFIPNRKVAWAHALAGGLLACLLFELAKRGLGWYLAQVPSYQQIYGTLAVIPIFLLWIYLSWVVVLLGASISASIGGFRFQPAAERLPEDAGWLAALRLMARFVAAQQAGRSLSLQRLRELESSIDDDLLNRLLEILTEAGLLARSEGADWLLAGDAHRLRLRELYAAVRAHVPAANPAGPASIDALGHRVGALVERQQQVLADVLALPLSTLADASADQNDAC